MVKLWAVPAILGILVSCSNSSTETTTVADVDSLLYENITMIQSVNDCTPDSGNCTYILFEYPQFGNATGVLGDSLLGLTNRYFQNEELHLHNKDSIQKAFLAEFSAFKKEQRRDVPFWYINRSLTVMNQNAKWITLCERDESFTGGAHPNTYVQYRIIDKRDGKQVTVADLFDPTVMPKVLELAETAFRSERGINPNQSLQEAGFWFKESRFALNDNFFISEDGITFFFNAYEVGPYTLGSTVFTLPANKVVKLLKK
jgi:hypothetical protein